MLETIKSNIAIIKDNIDAAVKKRRVDNGEVKLIAVTKTQPVEYLKLVSECGVNVFGENRVQEAQKKIPCFNDDIEWHLIGHLQTNKAKIAVQNFYMVHSVDSERVAKALQDAAVQFNKVQNVLLQVNVADEESKFGVAADEALGMIKYINDLPNLCLCGLMNIAPYAENVENIRPTFKEMYRLFCAGKEMSKDKKQFRWLSMGMTNDYQIAIEEGANMIRVGSGIFGERV